MDLLSKMKIGKVEIKEKVLSPGEKINRISTLGAELVMLRTKRNHKKAWTIPFHSMEILTELAFLGGSLDEQGFLVTEKV